MSGLVRSVVVAWEFLTVIPLSRRLPSPQDVGRSIIFFPLIGALIGVTLWGTYVLVSSRLPAPLTIVIVLALEVILSGGLHLDGFADTADAFGAANRAEARAVMKDPRIGVFGAAGITLLLLLKFASLLAIPSALLGPALVLMPAMGRWAMVTAGLKARPAGPDTEGVPSRLGAGFIRAVSWMNWAAATAILASFCLPICVLGLPKVGLTACLLFLVVIVGGRLVLVGRFGGLSGDMLGAIGEASEAAFLVGLLLGPP